MRRALVVPVVLGGLLGACTAPKPANPDAARATSSRYAPAEGVPGCRDFGEPQSVGRVPLALAELSGLAASTRHPGVLWAHNDSGNAFQVFALDLTGKLLATVDLTPPAGMDLRAGRHGDMDLEDIALGPCAPGEARTCLFLADTGDNFERRTRVRLWRLPEPETIADATLPVEELPFTWPDGPHDCEALVIEPGTGRAVLFTKASDSLGEVFAVQGLAPGQVPQAKRLGVVQAPGGIDKRTTAAALHPSGERLLLRTYTRVWELRQPGARRMEELLQGRVAEVPGASQAQAEAIAWLPEPDGAQASQSYVLGSEFAGQRLYRVDCR